MIKLENNHRRVRDISYIIQSTIGFQLRVFTIGTYYRESKSLTFYSTFASSFALLNLHALSLCLTSKKEDSKAGRPVPSGIATRPFPTTVLVVMGSHPLARLLISLLSEVPQEDLPLMLYYSGTFAVLGEFF